MLNPSVEPIKARWDPILSKFRAIGIFRLQRAEPLSNLLFRRPQKIRTILGYVHCKRRRSASRLQGILAPGSLYASGWTVGDRRRFVNKLILYRIVSVAANISIMTCTGLAQA